jgi:hypothetical protein
MLNFVLNIIAIVLLAVLLHRAIRNLQHEDFLNPQFTDVRFLSAAETKQFFLNDPDEYVHTLNQWDLIARKVPIFQDYLSKIANATLSFSEEQKTRISKAARDADEFFSMTHIEGIDCVQIASIPWVMALTNGKEYEDGLPHTRADIIFISTDLDQTHDTLVRTLIHEKVHLYQRLNPQDMMSFLAFHGYPRWKQRFGVPRVRSNPDLDPWIYFNPVTKKPMVAYYSSDTPANINDIALDNHLMEHPYEEIAYNIAKTYKGTDKNTDKKTKK